MRNANNIVHQKIALMQMHQAVLLGYLQILMNMQRVWETRPTTVTTSGRQTKTTDGNGNAITNVYDVATSLTYKVSVVGININ
jgi:hypothetical protein